MKSIVKVSSLIRISAFAVAAMMLVSGCSKSAPQEKKSEASQAATTAKTWTPEKPVTMVVNMAPGGPADLLARTIEKVWSKYCPQTVLIVNKPGAGGVEGATFVARSKPDGYTLAEGYGGGMDLVMPQLQKVNYDPFKDLVPVACLTQQPVYILVPGNSPIKSMKDVIDNAKKDNKPVTVAISSALNSEDLTMRAIAKATSVKFNQVPHSSGGQSLVTLMGGNTVLGTSTTPVFIAQSKDGRVRAIAQSLDGRDPMMPDVPSLKEQGIPFSCIGTVKGIATPPGTPKEIMAYYDDLFKKIAEDPDFKKTMADMAQPVVYKNSGDFTKFFKQAYEDYGKLIKDLGIEQQK
ncbi:MAG: Tat pathway signal sequence protein 13 [Clostridiales bacterium]|nr:Tat pathway signal sequence protein 13 [Clostridiales bacterium]